jgi:hypothetical protein
MAKKDALLKNVRVKIITLFLVLDTQFAKKQGHDLNHDPQES